MMQGAVEGIGGEEGSRGEGIWKSVEVRELPKPMTSLEELGNSPHHYLYICRK